MHYQNFRLYSFISFLLIAGAGAGQTSTSDTLRYKTVIAGPEFQNRPASFQKLWGKNRRVEWATPIVVPQLWLDTAKGGLKPYMPGGGNESKSLRLRSTTGKEFSLRSIYKSRADVIPPDFKRTFAEEIIIDQISCSHPYAALAVAVMQENAGIYHAEPIVVYLPRQPTLDTFNARFGNDLYLFEQRPDGDWSESANMGHFNDFTSTATLIKKLLENNKNITDQHTFIKARLFDMLIADWDRHEDNWRWGKRAQGATTLYIPVPRDRDQAFYTHNGKLVDKILPLAGLGFMQNFDSVVGNMKTFNVQERDMDRFFSNDMDQEDWVNAAKSLQQALTHKVIEASVRQLPPEIFAISGEELIRKLEARREQLVEVARSYYAFIAKQVEITGSYKREFFVVNRSATGETSVAVYRVNKNDQKEEQPYYQRTFKPLETEEVRIFGIGGEDIYSITGNSALINIRVIGGPGKDSINHTGGRIHIYDDRSNIFNTYGARLHLSSDSAIHAYRYDNYHYDSKGINPEIGYDREDRFYAGLIYAFTKHKWRRNPFATKQHIGVRYSISQNAISASYGAVFPNRIGNWDFFLDASFDAVRWTNFFGLGNEVTANTKNIHYYRLNSVEWLAQAGIRRDMGKSAVSLGVFYQDVNLKYKSNKYVATVYPAVSKVYASNNYAGFQARYSFASVNDAAVPTRGFNLLAQVILANNYALKEFFQNYTLKLQGWLPLSNKFSLSVKAGGTTIAGNTKGVNNPQYYQHAVIGGPESFRGYRMERFWGKTSFFNNNELRFITNINTHILNARFGLVGFFDDGRVWMPGESSSLIHTSYGGGILLAPFNQISFTLTYGISSDENMIQFRFNKLF